MANPSGRSFRVIDTTHFAAVAVLEPEIGTGNELVERPEMAESSRFGCRDLGHQKRRLLPRNGQVNRLGVGHKKLCYH